VTSGPDRGFTLDRFQVEATAAIDDGHSVLVSAPTGSGKTVVAEHAVARALAAGRRAFYTTPIKALSNQKYHDLVRVHGVDAVGLLTGDTAVNGDAPVVVMTTEVLRNMIYARSSALDGLQWVVLDEVHYLQDAYRGPVWEEVIVHLPADVRLVCLSATVSNAEELAGWLRTVRGPTTVVVEDRRPVSLDNWYLVADRLHGDLAFLPTLVSGRPNREGQRFDTDPRDSWRRGGGGRPRRRYATPGRVDVVEHLAERSLLPAIYFIFSRAACDDAVTACVGAGLRFTETDERARITDIVERHVEHLSDTDLDVLAYDRWLAALQSGIAAHHAGMVPPFKEAVEACFVEGLVKVVFATETLALGINMPARTVVIEKLTKYTGERHEFLTPGQYTQLTGRAGRRGIDDHGHAVVLWSPFVTFGDVAGLAASRTFRLTSAFRPTYNMAANLVRRYPADEAHRLLERSFAQYQVDAEVVRVSERLERRRDERAELAAAAECELGDARAYRELVDGAARPPDDDGSGSAEVERALAALKPGDVLWLDGTGGHGRVAVLSVAHRKGGAVRVRALTAQRRALQLGAADFEDPPEVVGSVTLPVPFTPTKPSFQRAVAVELERVAANRRGAPGDGGSGRGPRGRRRGSRAHGGGHDHPVERCPDRDLHLKALRRLDRVDTDIAGLERQVARRTGSLAAQFDRVLQMLEAWGHLDGWALTRRGGQLVRIYHECDLLLAEALEAGLLDDLDPPALAGLVSGFVYEHRASGPELEPWFPSRDVRRRADELDRLAVELADDERRLGLPPTRSPDWGFSGLAHAWASGQDLDDVLADDDLSGGDFVRTVRQLLDLLRQLGDAAAEPATAGAARAAADALHRGVVAASSAIALDEDDEARDLDDDTFGAGVDDTAGGTDRGVDGIADRGIGIAEPPERPERPDGSTVDRGDDSTTEAPVDRRAPDGAEGRP
jgi:ATP-dependent RNA helicase HelY